MAKNAMLVHRAAKDACELGLRGAPGPDVTGDSRTVAAIAHAIGAAVRKELDIAARTARRWRQVEIVCGVELSAPILPPPMQRIEIPKHVEEMTLEGWRD